MATARSRLDLALAVMPFVHRRQRERMLAWFDLMGAAAASDSRLFDIEVVMPWDRHRLGWRMIGPRTAMLEVLTRYLDTLGPRERRAAQLDRLGAIDPLPALGVWLEASDHGLEMGWFSPVALPIAAVTHFVGESADRQALVHWCHSHGVGVCESLVRSVHPEQPWTEFWLPLPGVGQLEQLYASRAIYRGLAMPLPDNDAYAGLLRAATGPLVFVLALSRSGPVRIGLAARAPTAAGAMQLAEHGGGFQPEAVVAFQRALGGMQGPSAVTWVRDASRAGAELSFSVTREPDAVG